jgi:hypothetical protein
MRAQKCELPQVITDSQRGTSFGAQVGMS